MVVLERKSWLSQSLVLKLSRLFLLSYRFYVVAIFIIQKKVRADNVLLVEKFAKALYSNMSKEDLANRNDSDLYGAALSLCQRFGLILHGATYTL